MEAFFIYCKIQKNEQQSARFHIVTYMILVNA